MLVWVEPVGAMAPQILVVQAADENAKPKVRGGASEAKLQQLAQAERARRQAAVAEKQTKKAEHRPPSGRPPSAAPAAPPPQALKSVRFAQERPPTAQSERPTTAQSAAGDKVAATVVGVHTDGTVDLLLASGEVMERVKPHEVSRRMRNEDERPSSAASIASSVASSRPGTGGSRVGGPNSLDSSRFFARHPVAASNPSDEQKQALGALKQEHVALKAELHAQQRQQQQLAATSSPSAAKGVVGTVRLDKDLSEMADLAIVEAGVARKGGRRSLSAARAAQSEMSSLLSWE